MQEEVEDVQLKLQNTRQQERGGGGYKKKNKIKQSVEKLQR